MSLFKKINAHYNFLLLKDLARSKKYDEFFNQIESISKNQKFLLNNAQMISQVINESTDDNKEKKIIWLNAYDYDDLVPINNFLDFYFNEISYKIDGINSYELEVSKIYQNTDQENKINFNEFIDFSYFYQWYFLFKSQGKIRFINNQLPFFSTRNNFNFSKPTLTLCYFYLIDDPYQVYQDIKNKNNGDSEVARNIFLNLDNNYLLSNIGGSLFEINKQGWHTHVSSWRDANVINSLKGKFIYKKNIYSDPYDTFSSIIFHLIQSGAEIELNYDVIQKYVNKMPKSQKDSELTLSNKEKKFIDQYVKNISLDIDVIKSE